MKTIYVLRGVLFLAVLSGQCMSAQTLWVPSGTAGIGSATSTGNVGIGTSNPQGRLDIGEGAGGNSIVWGGSSGANHYASIGASYSSAALSLVLGLKLDQTDDRYLYSYASIARAGIRVGGNYSDISFFNAPRSTRTVNGVFDYVANTKVIIKENGDVGIGTTNPTQKLSVNGTIRAKEVIVDTGWSDYVFAPDYKLALLSEVETHIKQNGHLPGIPSAKEVAEYGVSMGEMQAKLLAKIEELTLHVIKQEKNQIEQEKRAQAQHSEIATLRSELIRVSNRSTP